MDKAKSRVRGKAWYDVNAERHLANGKKRYDDDPEKKIKQTTAHGAKARRENPTVRLAHNCRMRLQVYFKNGRFKKDASTSKLIGMTFPKLMKRLCEMAGIVEMTEDHHRRSHLSIGALQSARGAQDDALQQFAAPAWQRKPTQEQEAPHQGHGSQGRPRPAGPTASRMDMLPDVYPGWRTPLRM